MILKCTREKNWQKTLAKVFDDEQLQKIEAREASRREMAVDQAVSDFVLSLIRSLEIIVLTAEQHEKLVSVIKEYLGDSRANYSAVRMSFIKVSDEELQEILTEDQWKTFQTVLGPMRDAFNTIGDMKIWIS